MGGFGGAVPRLDRLSDMDSDVAVYLAKAAESLDTAESELRARRYNSCANRCYYAAFQAAIAALIEAGIRGTSDEWPHKFVQSSFAGQLINRRRLYPPAHRSTLSDLQHLRSRADYSLDLITEVEANRGFRRCRDFVEAVQQKAGGRR